MAPDYFTTALSNRKVSVIEEEARQKLGRAESAWGEVSVVEKVVGYKKIKFHTHENAGYGDVRLPDTQMHTTSFWLTVPEALCEELGMGRAAAIEGLRGLAVALETVSALALMCDPRDLGQTLGDDGEEGAPAGGGRVPQPGFDPDALPLRQRPRRRGPRGAHLRAIGGAARPRARAGADLRLPRRLPGVRGRDRDGERDPEEGHPGAVLADSGGGVGSLAALAQSPHAPFVHVGMAVGQSESESHAQPVLGLEHPMTEVQSIRGGYGPR